MARNPVVIRAERERILEKIEAQRLKVKALTIELQEAEGPIPDRSHRPKDVNFSVTKDD